jgi:hypothetical protein
LCELVDLGGPTAVSRDQQRRALRLLCAGDWGNRRSPQDERNGEDTGDQCHSDQRHDHQSSYRHTARMRVGVTPGKTSGW